jgi:hypothetical protein
MHDKMGKRSRHDENNTICLCCCQSPFDRPFRAHSVVAVPRPEGLGYSLSPFQGGRLPPATSKMAKLQSVPSRCGYFTPTATYLRGTPNAERRAQNGQRPHNPGTIARRIFAWRSLTSISVFAPSSNTSRNELRGLGLISLTWRKFTNDER